MYRFRYKYIEIYMDINESILLVKYDSITTVMFQIPTTSFKLIAIRVLQLLS